MLKKIIDLFETVWMWMFPPYSACEHVEVMVENIKCDILGNPIGGHRPKEQPGHVRGEPPKGHMPVKYGSIPEFFPYPCCGLSMPSDKFEYQVVSVKSHDGTDIPYRLSEDGRHVTLLLDWRE